MTDEEKMKKIVRQELGNRGYVVNVDARKEGQLLVGTLHVTSAETDDTVAKLVGVGDIDGMHLCFGVDAEGTIRDTILRALSTWQGMQAFIPTVEVKTPKP